MRKYGQSLRVALSQITMSLVLFTGVTSGFVAFWNTENIVRALSAEVFEAQGNYAAARAADYAISAEQSLALTHRLFTTGRLPTDLDGLGRYFVDVVRSNPRLSSTIWGDTNGNAIWASRHADGRILVERYADREGESALHQTFLAEPGGEWTLLIEERSDYDPRVRPWFIQARDVDTPEWTEPYLFVPQYQPGISVTRRVTDADGALVGVLGVDFELSFLSASLKGIDYGDGDQGVIFDEQGFVIGHSSPEGTRVQGEDGAPQIAHLADHPDPLVQRLVDVIPQVRSSREPTLQRVEHDGEWYSVAVHVADVGSDKGSLTWLTAVIVAEANLLSDVRRNGMYSAIIAGLGLCLTLLLSLIFSRWITDSFYAFHSEMQRVGRLDLAERELPTTLIREVHQLGDNLRAMKVSLRSFERYVPSALVSELFASGVEARPGGEARELTVLFTDVAGFTTISESLPPQVLAERLSRHLEVLSEVIQSEHGTVDKYIGDAIMAFWNAPMPVPDHALRACRAALGLIAAVEASRGDASPLWDIRVGVNTAVAVVGNLGSERRLNYTAIGDGVNLASRLEGINKDYGTKLLVGQSTVEQLGGAMLVRPVDQVIVKGQTRPEQIYEVMADGEGDARQRALAEATAAAFALWTEGRLAEAAAAYAACLELEPADGVAKRMRERCLAEGAPD